MTYLEVHTEWEVHRWPIVGVPDGKTEEDFCSRVEFINAFLSWYDENMAYAFEDAKIYIIHQSNFQLCDAD